MKTKELYLKAGDLVHYIPFDACEKSLYQNGKVKSVRDDGGVFVVYSCNEEWDTSWMNYTAQRTPIKRLKKGWI